MEGENSLGNATFGTHCISKINSANAWSVNLVVGCRLPNNSVSALRPISTQFVFLGGSGRSLDAALSGWTCAAARVTVWTVAVLPTIRNLVPLLNDHRGECCFCCKFYTRYTRVLCGVLAVCSRVLYSWIRIPINFRTKGSECKIVLPDLLWPVYVQF